MTSRQSLTPPYPSPSMWMRADRSVVLGNGNPLALLDLSGNGNNGVGGGNSVSGASWVPTLSPRPCINFTPSADDVTTSWFFNVADSASLKPGTGSVHQWCVAQMPAAWPTTHSTHGIFHKFTAQYGANTDGFGLAINVGAGSGNGNVIGTVGNLSSFSDTLTLALNGLYLIEYNYDGAGNHSIFVNGTMTNSGVTVTTSATNTQILGIGVDVPVASRLFKGLLFECGVNIPSPSAAAQIVARRTIAARYGLTVP